MPKDKLLKRYGSFVPAASKNLQPDGGQRHEHRARLRGLLQGGIYVPLYRGSFHRQDHRRHQLRLLCGAAKQRRGMVSVRDLPMGDYLLEDNIQLKETRRGMFTALARSALSGSHQWMCRQARSTLCWQARTRDFCTFAADFGVKENEKWMKSHLTGHTEKEAHSAYID